MYVGNLPWDTTEEQLSELFVSYGEVISSKIITDRETGRSRGFGFVEMDDIEEAIKEMDGKEVGGRPLKVNEAREKTQGDRGGSRGSKGSYGDRQQSRW